jgi:hypothetical protein
MPSSITKKQVNKTTKVDIPTLNTCVTGMSSWKSFSSMKFIFDDLPRCQYSKRLFP